MTFNAPLKKLVTGFDRVARLVWMGDAGCLLFSDIPKNKILRWSPDTGLSTYRALAGFTNGHTRDRQGRLVSCEHGRRRVTRTEWDGTFTVLADRFQGKPLNSPIDVVVKSDGPIWFTDPHYGIMTNGKGHKSTQELPCNVYRINPDGTIKAVLTDFNRRTACAFSQFKPGFLWPIPGGYISRTRNISACLTCPAAARLEAKSFTL